MKKGRRIREKLRKNWLVLLSFTLGSKGGAVVRGLASRIS